mgnify:CR=1 FL=1
MKFLVLFLPIFLVSCLPPKSRTGSFTMVLSCPEKSQAKEENCALLGYLEDNQRLRILKCRKKSIDKDPICSENE